MTSTWRRSGATCTARGCSTTIRSPSTSSCTRIRARCITASRDRQASTTGSRWGTRSRAARLWEIAGETTLPSRNDQIATGIGGSFLGEPLFRLASLILERIENRPGFWRELSAAVISPSTGFNRLVYGDRFRGVFPSRDPAFFTRVQFGMMGTASVQKSLTQPLDQKRGGGGFLRRLRNARESRTMPTTARSTTSISSSPVRPEVASRTSSAADCWPERPTARARTAPGASGDSTAPTTTSRRRSFACRAPRSALGTTVQRRLAESSATSEHAARGRGLRRGRRIHEPRRTRLSLRPDAADARRRALHSRRQHGRSI